MEALIENPSNWVALAFVVFAFGFYKLAMKHILKGLDARSARIRSEIDEAIRLKEEAKELLAEFQQKQVEMTAEAEAILKHAEREAKALRVQAEKTLAATIERRTQMAHERIARAEAEAMSDIQSMMASLSTQAARSLIEAHLSDSQRSHLIDEALADAQRLVH